MPLLHIPALSLTLPAAEACLMGLAFLASALLLGAVFWCYRRERRLRQHLQQAQQRADRFRKLFAETGDAVFAYPLQEGTALPFIEVSRRACDTLGYTRPELERRALSDLLHPEAGLQLPAHIETLQAKRHAVHEFTLQTAEGEACYLELNSRLFTLDGVPTVVSVACDVAERRRYEHGLMAAQQEAEKQNRRKSAFLSNMSHEIRTPLTGIIGFADVLAEEADEPHQEFARTIGTSGERLLDTVNSVLDLARLNADELNLSPTRIDVVQEVRSAVELLQPLAKEKDLKLHLKSGFAELWAQQDPSTLVRIVNNLVGNAIKFTEQGHITVNIHADAEQLYLKVKDTGIGISKEFLPSLFDPFQQETGLDEQSGSGLGLAITKRVVQLLGGSIEVESEKGVGSTFYVALPRTLSDAPLLNGAVDEPDSALNGSPELLSSPILPDPMRWQRPYEV